LRSNAKAAVEARRAARVTRLRGELDRMLGLLRTRPDVQKVILAGSLARGRPHAHSDIDLVIVQQSDKPFLDRLGEFYGFLRPTVGTDVLVYTPEEWRDLSVTRPFCRRLNREGVILYESGRP
jgi:predicted nucleotidyltransferase